MPKSKKRRPKTGASQPAVTLDSALRAFHRQELPKAAKQCRLILARTPDNAAALNLLGGILLMSEDAAAAIEVLTRAAALKPDDATIQSNLGAALATAGRFEKAAKCFLAALRRTPGDVDIRLNLGRAQRELGQYGAARENLVAALAAAPDNIEFLVEAARASLGDGDAADAELYLRKALAIDPDNQPARRELVRALYESGRYAESLDCANIALRNEADCPALHVDHGLILSRLERYDEALSSFNNALTIDPDNADATFGRALVNLQLGQFGAGWKDYRARQSMRSAERPNSLGACGAGFHQEILPADLSGKRILVVIDQGLGDEIFFLRYAARLRERGARLAYQPDERLAAMLGRSAVADEIVSGAETSPTYDFRIAVCDLPWLTGATDDQPVAPSIEIPPVSARKAQIANELAAFGRPPYIGVTWRAGSAGDSKILFKEIPVERLARVIAGVDGSVIILQRNPAEGEITAFSRAAGRPVLDLSNLNTDLEAMLALCSLLDLYVAVSNTNIHLREACGRPSHVIVPFPPEFRWMASGNESPWFPGTRLYRQQADGCWDPAIDGLTRDLSSEAPLLKAAV